MATSERGHAYTLAEVAAFLDGGAPLDGVWFDESHPTESGAYWWRKHLRAALSAAEARVWQPIETAPKDGTQIIVTNGTLRLAVRWWPGIGWSDNGRHDLLWGPVTHWMPLPAAPTSAAHTGEGGEHGG